jgi:ceramide glucosyltransferase
MQPLGVTLLLLAFLGVGLLAAQLVALRRHLRVRPPPAGDRPPLGLSILKPLCGIDDELPRNLQEFATLPYPRYELLLGVRDIADPAYPVALAAAARWPERVRVVVQRGEPGLNPKVNQLITLAAEARHDVVVVSDSNVRPTAGYLEEIAAHLSVVGVGLVTNPLTSGGESCLGSILDGLHVSCAMGPAVVAAKRVAGQDLVIGKSMALHRYDLSLLGGFACVKDVLAEDYLLGRLIPERLGKRVVIGSIPVVQICGNARLEDFLRRFLRWAVLRRKSVPLALYVAELILNPIALALVGLMLSRSLVALGAAASVIVGKTAIDALTASELRPAPLPRWAWLLVPLKDALIAGLWARALFLSAITWRGNRLLVLPGTRLATATPERHPIRPRPGGGGEARVVLRHAPEGRHHARGVADVLAPHHEDHHLRQVRGVVADALQVLGDRL